MTLERSRKSGCFSDLRLDQWSRGELSATDAETVAQHLESCPLCSARRLDLDRHDQAFAAEAPAFDAVLARAQADTDLHTRHARHSRTRWVVLSACGSLAAAAALLLPRLNPETERVATMSSTVPELRSLGTRAKGGPKLGFFVRRGAQVFEGQPGQTLHPGDALRFTVSTPAPRHVAVLSVDAAGVVSVYHPQGGAPDATLSGVGHPLATATQLDGTLGGEILYGVFCQEPTLPEILRAAVVAAPQAPRFPEGCEFDRVSVVKERP